MVDIKIDTSNLEHGAIGNAQGIDFVPRSQASELTSTVNEKPQLLTVPGAQDGNGRSNSVSSAGSSHNHWDDGAAGVPAAGEDRETVLETAREIMVARDEDETGPFAFTTTQLQALVDPKNLEVFRQMGGLHGLARGLQSDLQQGLSWDETTIPVPVTLQDALAASDGSDKEMHKLPIAMTTPTPGITKKPTLGIKKSITVRSTMKVDDDKMTDRKRIYKANVLPTRKTKNIFQLMWIALQDKVLILLSIAAVISLALGLYETFGEEPDIDAQGNEIPQLDWVEGVAIVVAIAIVTIVGSANDYQKERQFVKLNKKKEDRKVTVIRSGSISRISVYDIVVGDVMQFEPGDVLPVDGVMIQGHNVKCDESAATGESDTLKKISGIEAVESTDAGEAFSKKADPFMLSGAKVSEGVGTFLVTAVGVHSFNGKTMMALQTETEDTPLQQKLNVVATTIAKLGGAAALLLFIVSFIEYLVRLRGNTGTASQKGQEFLDLFIIAVTVIVVAIPEGLPLAVTLALAFATTRMLKDNNLVRILKSCETMGNATTICSDKTGTLTQNSMTVVAGTLSLSHSFTHSVDAPREPTGDLLEPEKDKSAEEIAIQAERDVARQLGGNATPTGQFTSKLGGAVKDVLLKGIAINSTAFEGVDEHGKQGFVGSKTETALLEFAKLHLGMEPVATVRANNPTVHLIPFSSEKKCMGAVTKLADGSFRLHLKGASEIILGYCAEVIQDPFIDDSKIICQPLTGHDREKLEATISRYANQSLRTIGLAYKDFPQWPPANLRPNSDGGINLDELFTAFTLIGIVGIQDPLRPGVKQAVLDCQGAGVVVRMVTGDNMITARAIATECGIYNEAAGGIIMEGPQFRRLGHTEMDHVIPSLQVLARSSPEDKQILVRRLKQLGETVAVTGDGTNDGPALKMADVGFSMGIAGTEVAKEASAIILMDDNFSSIVKAMAWGRAVNDAVKKFLQFQITVNITAVLLTFISVVSGNDSSSVLTAVQLLWVNLIMDTLAALALATDPPTDSILKRKPAKKSDNLITFDMWKMIIGQAIYQLTITLILYYAGTGIFGWDENRTEEEARAVNQTVVFNAFVWCQIFNQLNNRRLDNKLNVFEGITRNWFYWIINIVMVAGQVMIIFVGGRAFSVVRIGGAEWAISIVVGLISIPVAIIIRLIPNNAIRPFIPAFILEWDKRKPIDISDEERAEWNPAVNQVRDELAFIRNIRSSRRIGNLGLHAKKKQTAKYFAGNKDQHKRAASGSVAAALLLPSFVATGPAGFGPPSSPAPSQSGYAGSTRSSNKK